MKKDALIDLCRDWIGQRGAAYLAKENSIVYYTSHTGRKSDFAWQSLTVPELIRIITATLMNPEDSGKLKTEHVIAACQELDRVFEFAVKTRHKTREGIFNFLTEADQDMGDQIMSMLVEELYQRSYYAFLMACANMTFESICTRLSVKVSAKDRNELLHKHFPAAGYVIRTDKYRPQIDGRKQSAIMMEGTKPKDVVQVPDEVLRDVSTKIYGALK